MYAPPDVRERVRLLYETHQGAMRRFFVGKGLSTAIAEELTQEVFVRLFTTLARGGVIESQRAWLYGVAAKVAVDYRRREGSSMWMELEAVPAMAYTLRSHEPQPETVAMRNEQFRRANDALARLPEKQREAIRLRMRGLKYRDIARTLGVSLSTVSEWIDATTEKLRKAANG